MAMTHPALVEVPLPSPLVPVRFARRLNRFAVEGEVRGQRLRLHLPNSGRMEELLVRGAQGLALLRDRPRGATAGILLLVRHAGRWVGLDARLPNRLFEALLRAQQVPFVGRPLRWRREVVVGGCRIDFLVEGEGGTWLVETKSCNRVDAGVALFPDAPTLRGTAHLQALERHARAGGQAAVVWFVQRDDAHRLRPFAARDPAFAHALTEAARVGVRMLAYTCAVAPEAVTVVRSIPVLVEDR